MDPDSHKVIYSEEQLVQFKLSNGADTYSNPAPGLVTSRPGNPVSGIEDIVNPLEKKLNVFPNPVMNGYDLNIANTFGQFGENATLDVYDITGRLVYEQEVELNEDKKIIIPSDKINSLIEGTYFIHINSTGIKMMAKFVILQK